MFSFRNVVLNLLFLTLLLLIFYWVLFLISNQLNPIDSIGKIEIFLATVTAVTGWWLKLLYEKWEKEKSSIAKLQRIYSKYIDTQSKIISVEKQLLNNIQDLKKGKIERYHNHIPARDIIDNSIIDGIRNIELLNVIFKNQIQIDYHNSVLELLWKHYNDAFADLRKDDGLESYFISRFNDLDITLAEFIQTDKELLDDMILCQAHLYVAGEKMTRMRFNSLTSIISYRYTESEVAVGVKNINEQLTNQI
jgi:hypothetical protein